MRFYSTLFLLAASSSVCLVPMVNAYSSGAGGCSEGMPAVGSPHLSGGVSTTITNGTLDDGTITVLLDGTAITAETAVSFAAGVNHTLTLQRDSGFKGLLFRLGGSVGTSALQVADGSNLQVAGVCTSASASGITHTDNSVKMEASLVLFVESAVSSLPLDVTVVISNSGTSEFYYSPFVLNAVALTSPTPAPVAPTETTLAPTSSSTEAPSIAPVATTDAPSTAPAVASPVAPVASTTAPVASTTAPVAPTTPKTSAGCGMSFAVVAALGLLTSTLSCV